MNTKLRLFFVLLILSYTKNSEAQSITYSALFDNSTFSSRTISLADVGTIKGTAGTSNSGAGTYTIALPCPPGSGGVIPEIGLVYSSQGGNGVVGQGWSISGLSVISRNGKDIYHEGSVGPVTYTNADVFSVDGNRLSAVSGPNGADLTTYKTEAESYSTTTSYGTVGGGPQFFNVVSKDGTIRQYGNSADSRVMSDDGSKVMMWRLNKIVDVNGNYIWFTYEYAGRDSRIKEISYTGNQSTGLEPYNRISFNYALRDDKNTFYDNGYTTNMNYLLSGITIHEIATSETFRSYALAYGKNATNNSYLKYVSVYNGDGDRMNETRFKYGDEATDLTYVQSDLYVDWFNPATTTSTNYDIFSGDYDGDGKTEILRARYNYVGATYYNDRNYVDFSVYKQTSPSSYSLLSGSSTTLPAGGGANYLYSYQRNSDRNGYNFMHSDFNGDGKDDLLFMNINSSNLFDGVTIYYSNMGTSSPGFSPTVMSAIPLSGDHQMIGENILLTGDFDGDKRSDYMYMTEHTDPSTGHDILHTFVTFPGKSEINKPIMLESNPSSYDQTATATIRNNAGMGGITTKVYVLDFDGDGTSEIMCSQTDGNTVYKLAKTSGGVYYFKELVHADGYPTERYQDIKAVGDFNGDGITDLLVNSKATRSYWELAYGTGKGFIVKPFYYASGKAYQNDCTYGGGTDTKPDDLFVADFNGDGKSDILHRRKYCTSGESLYKSDFMLYSFNGLGTYISQTFFYPYALSGMVRPVVTDENGDGKAELSFKRASLTAAPAGSGQEYMHTMYFRKDDKSHLMEKVSDGFDRTTTFRYKPLTQTSTVDNFYTKGSGETYPVNNAQYPIYVVDMMWEPDGIGGSNINAFTYENFRLHRAGRGFLGFEKIIAYSTSNDVRTESLYGLNTSFYIPYLKTIKTYLHNNTSTPLSRTDNTVSFDPVGSSYCFKQNTSRVVSKDFLTATTDSSEFVYDTNGNLTYSESIKKETASGNQIHKTKMSSTYIALGGGTILNKPNYVYIENKRGTGTLLGMISNITYDSKGRAIYIHKTPNISTIPTIRVQEMQYDDYGNITQKTDESVVGHIPVWPVTKYEYDTKGRFVVKEINPDNDFTTISTHKFWGKPLSVTGINGLTSYNTYNGWGKLTSATIPTAPGVSYTVTYQDGWDISGNQLYYLQSTDPSAPDQKTWYDMLDRPVKVQQEGFSGWTTALTTYTAKGKVASGTNSYYSTETPMVTTNTYDDYNRISSVTDFSGTTNYVYTNGTGTSTTTVNLPDGKVKVTVTDATGKIIKSSNDDVSKTVYFYYDSHGNETNTRLGNSGTEYHNLITKEYDGLGRMTKISDPDAGTITYEYDAFGRTTKQTDALGKVTEFTYDKMNRMLTKSIDAGSFTTTYLYYDKTYDYKLKQEKVVFGPSIFNVEDNYEYAIGGGMTKHTRINLGNLFEKSYTYDAYGRLAVTDYLNSGFKKLNVYNSNGYLKKITTYMSGGSGEKTLYECTGMNGNGQVTGHKRVDGLLATSDYTNGYLTGLNTSGKQHLVMNYDFSNGNLNYRADHIVGTNESFIYDGANRLINSSAVKTAVLGGPPGMSHAPISVTYHGNFTGSFGRIESKSDIGTYGYPYFPRNAVASVTDPSGVISHATQDILYRPFHKTAVIAEEVGGVNYKQIFEYDANENRAYSEQWQGTTGGVTGTGGAITHKRWYFGDLEVDQDITTSSTKIIHYITGSNGLCGMVVDNGGSFQYYGVYTDHLGSIVTVTDETSNVVAMQSFDAWGRERQPDTWGYIPSLTSGGIVVPVKPDWLYRGFTGHEMLPEYGLINMNGRMYDPINGRMLRPDNFVTYPGNSQSYNRYSYALNNPLKYTDPDGNHPIIVGMIVGAAIAASTYTYEVARSDHGFANWNWGNFAMTTLGGGIRGGVAGGIGAGIGDIFGSTGSILNELGRAGAHGLSNYIMSGGEKSAFLSGAFGSAAGSLGNVIGGPLDTKVGGTLFAAAVSGTSSAIGGGDFVKGAVIGATVHMVNYLGHPDQEGDRNPKQDKPLTAGEIQKLKDNEWDHSHKGKHGGRTDLYKDRQGNVYQKPKGGVGEGEPIGINLNDLKTATVVVGAGIIIYETLKWGIAILAAPETLGASLVLAGATP